MACSQAVGKRRKSRVSEHVCVCVRNKRDSLVTGGAQCSELIVKWKIRQAVGDDDTRVRAVSPAAKNTVNTIIDHVITCYTTRTRRADARHRDRPTACVHI